MTEQKHLEIIAAAKAEYDEVVHTGSAAVVKEKSDALRAAINELSAFLSEGAQPCPKCENAPIGMQKANIPNTMGMEIHVYEVGCVNCPPEKTADGRRKSYAARGVTPEQAVEKWNAGDFVIDDKEI